MIPSTTARSAILGVPLDVNKQPSGSGVVRAFEQMDARIIANSAGALIRNSLANLSTLVSPAAGAMAWVIGDATVANNGVYENTGTSGLPAWTRRCDLPFAYIHAINVGAGTANEIEVTTAIPIPAADGAAEVLVPVVTTNTSGTVTLSINGETLPLKTQHGNNPSIGGLTGFFKVIKLSSNWRMLTDQVSSAVLDGAEAAQAAAETAQGAAEAAAASAGQRFIRVHVVDTTGGDPLTGYEAGDTVDGVTLTTGMLILRATDGGDPSDGVYVAPASGAASRSTLFDTYDKNPGSAFRVMQGTVLGNTEWRCTSVLGGTLDTTDLVFSEFSGASTSPVDVGGRLTLVSGEPEMDQTADHSSVTLYFAPLTSDQLPIFNGSRWVAETFTASALDQVGLSMVGGTAWVADEARDVFAINDGGTIKLATSGAWAAADMASRGLIKRNGVWVNDAPVVLDTSAATTAAVAANCATWLGSINPATTGTLTATFTLGQNRRCDVWNLYHKVEIKLGVHQPPVGGALVQWTPSNLYPVVAAFNNDTSNSGTYFTGLPTNVDVNYHQRGFINSVSVICAAIVLICKGSVSNTTWVGTQGARTTDATGVQAGFTVLATYADRSAVGAEKVFMVGCNANNTSGVTLWGGYPQTGGTPPPPESANVMWIAYRG